MHFELPCCRQGWLRVIDTALPSGEDLPSQPEAWLPGGAPLQSRSLMLLVAAPLLEGRKL
jgi:glycogen operon protein